MKSVIKASLGLAVSIIGIIALYNYVTYGYQYIGKAKNKNKYEKPENPKERELWRLKRRGGFVDPLARQRAFKGVQKMLSSQSNQPLTKDAGLNNWTELGPYGVGGRVRSFVVDPNNNNHIHIGAVGGGIWETWNGGTTWNQVTDFLPTLAVADMEYDPFDNTTIYASTGEGVGGGNAATGGGGSQPGLGVFKSTNNGNTWTLLNGPAGGNFFWVNDIVLDPTRQDWIYAVTSNASPNNNGSASTGRVYRSQNGGSSWSLLASLSSKGLDVKIDPFNSNIILVGCADHLYRCTNAGNANPTFTEITGGANQIPATCDRVEISFCPSNSGRVYASVENNQEVWRSENSGATWTERNATGLDGGASWFTNVIWVDPINSSKLIVGGVDIYRSTDGGNTFTQISDWADDINGNDGGGNNSIHADSHMIIPYNSYNGINQNGVYIANDGGLYSTNNIWTVTENSGWLSNVGDLAITECYGGAMSANASYLIAGTQDNSFALSDDSGSSWTQPLTGDGGYAAIDYTDEDRQYANLNNHALYRSTNGGNSWSLKARFGGGNLHNCTTSNPNGCVPFASGVFHVNDGAGLVSLFVMDPNDPDNILVGAQRLWRNTNRLATGDWTPIKSAISGNPLVSAICVDVGASARIWVGYDDGTLQRTTNTGSSWSGNLEPSGSPGNPYVTSIAINPNNSNQVIVTYGGYNNNNVFYTGNGNVTNPTWTNIETGLAIQVNSVVWHPSNSDWIYLGTDFGILASEDKGSTWSVTPLYTEHGHEGPVNTEVSQLFWQHNTTRLIAVTHGRGMWRSNSIYDKIYVDKNQSCVFPNLCIGTFSFPFQTLAQANAAAGHGSEIIFLSGGTHNQVTSPLVIDKRLDISLSNGGNPVIIE